MIIDSKEEIIQILKTNKLFAKKKFGQHFLVDEEVVNDIITAANLKSTDRVLEIGPGLGTLTQALAKKIETGLILAVEKDRDFVEWLRKIFKHQSRVKIVAGDILVTPLNALLEDRYKVVANVPYFITSPIITKFLLGDYRERSGEKVPMPGSMTLMIQKEVAERITAEPGTRERGALTVLVELFGGAKLVRTVSRSAFFPAPKVDSAVIHIDLHDPVVEPTSLWFILKSGFTNKRRMIHNSLAGSLRLSNEEAKNLLEKARINPLLRAEQLTLEQWIDLHRQIGQKVKGKKQNPS